MRAQIPNLITLGNLFCGCCALVLVLAGQPHTALWFTLGSFACDTADGLVARALGVSSPLGVQLDSLADVVSFGVVPGAMLFYLLRAIRDTQILAEDGGFCLAALPAFVLSMAAAYRLGKFNVDTRQKTYFLGLSTPACTVFVLGLTVSAHYNRFGLGDWLNGNGWVVYVLVALLSWLMVSEIPLAGLKIKGFRWRGNEALIILLVLFVGWLFVIKELAFCAVIVAYILYSLFNKKSIVGTA